MDDGGSHIKYCWKELSRLCINSTYSGLSSISTAALPNFIATSPVVPAPAKGSSTVGVIKSLSLGSQSQSAI